METVRVLRVGGTYWAAQPELPDGCVIVRSATALAAAKRVAGARRMVLWEDGDAPSSVATPLVVSGECDPWHMLSGAFAVVVARRDDDLRIVAGLLNVPCYIHSATGDAALDTADASTLLDEAIGGTAFDNPFTGEPMTLIEAVELCGFWRASDRFQPRPWRRSRLCVLEAETCRTASVGRHRPISVHPA